MIEWAVIADDLTGAADTGIRFRPVAAPVLLADHRRVEAPALLAAAPRTLAVFTTSRALPRDRARRVAAEAGRALRRLRPARTYKKIDSGLRGNIGPELEGVMEALGVTLSFIAPAFPDQGRTTLDGIHRIHGVPVAQSEMGRDPVTPVTDSELPRWLAAQSAWPVGHVGRGTLDRGIDAAAADIIRLRGQGVRHIGFDATHTRHLDLVARLGLERFPEALLCGSAGLAGHAAARLSRDRAVAEQPPATSLQEGGLIFVCGSASERLRAQATRLVERCGTGWEALCAESLAAGELPDALVERTAQRLAAGDLLLTVRPFDADALGIDPQQVVSGLARLVQATARRARTAGLFLSGGDTALAVLASLEADALQLEHELSSGLVYGVIVGGPWAGLTVVTKAGSFGGPDALVEVCRCLCTGRSFTPGT